MKKWFTFFLAGACIANTSKAQSKQIQFVKYELPNGLKVILHQDKSAPVVAVTALYHVGSKNEDTARTGFAHFFEHLLFEGSENIKRGEFDKYVTKSGGALNANTTTDRTFYYELLPSNQLKMGLWLESERMLHAKIEDVGVNTQREVVKEEKRQRYDNQPYGSILPEMMKRAFTVHPYKWTPIGSMDHLNAAKLEEFIQFYKTYYVPNNCVLSIAGDINIDSTKKMIDQYFSDIPKGTRPMYRPNITEPTKTKEVRDTVFDNIQLPMVIQAYNAPKQGSDEYYAFNMLATLLAGGSSAKLNKALVDDQELALQVGSFPFFMEDAGLFINYALPNMGVPVEKLESSIDSIVNSLKSELISDREFKKINNQVESEFVSKNDNMAGIAESLANYEVYFGDANLINTEINKYKKVTKEDLRNVAKKYLNATNRVVLYYLPKSKK